MIIVAIQTPAYDTFSTSDSPVLERLALELVPLTETDDGYELAEESDDLFGLGRQLHGSELEALRAVGCNVYPA